MKKYFLLFFLLLGSWAMAQSIPDAPKPARLVNDFAGILSGSEVSTLEQKLISYEDSTSNQVAIVLIKSLEGYDVADYANRLAAKWGVGSKKNNGVLVLLAIEDRKSRIEVGYGLEGKITDAISKRILTESRERFKAGDYYGGLQEVTDRIARAAAGEYQGDYQYSKKKKRKSSGGGWGLILFILFVLFLISLGGGKGGRGGGGGFLTGWLLGQMLSGGHRSRGGGWGDFSSGGGSFGGFGGGSFGGGGASGDW